MKGTELKPEMAVGPGGQGMVMGRWHGYGVVKGLRG